MQHNYCNNGKLYIRMQHNYCNNCKLYIRMQHNYFNNSKLYITIKHNYCNICKLYSYMYQNATEFVCLFVCLVFFVPLEYFQLIRRRHHCRWRVANFDLCLALLTIEQWGFLSVPYLLWSGPSVYNGHLRGPVTLTPNAERLAEQLLFYLHPVFLFLDI